MSSTFEEGEEIEPAATCGFCGGPCVVLGTLGTREHLRCQNCGMEWSWSVVVGDDADEATP
jgi:hypothetical protein